jgi:hypothetical protein
VQAPSWRDEISVHPTADIFLMADQELAELGNDIKTNGKIAGVGDCLFRC